MLSPTPFGPETVEQISLGIVSSVRATANLGKLDVDLTSDDFKFEKDWNFVKVKSRIGSKGLLVTAFAPKVFYRIRQFHGVKEEAFQESWTLSEENRKTKEGAGRSGSLFCFSEDRRYIFKTIYEDEKDTLMNFLPAYYDHITKNPCSLLQRIYGLFFFENLKSYVLVFGNLLYSPKGPPQEIFDLKGREVKPGHEEMYDDEKVKKDKNLKRKFRFGEVMHEQLLHHLEIDVGLLKTYNIMDYSLLIGIRDDTPSDPSDACSRAADGTPLSVSVFGMSDGGFRGGSTNDEDKNIIYHIGIIDCLTNYGLRKKLANFCKSMRWRVESLSTVDADYYALRFLDFMKRILVTEDMEGAFDPPLLNTAPPASFFSSSTIIST